MLLYYRNMQVSTSKLRKAQTYSSTAIAHAIRLLPPTLTWLCLMPNRTAWMPGIILEPALIKEQGQRFSVD